MPTTSETTAKLEAAIAKAQAGMTNAGKDATNPAFKRDGQGAMRYATLASVLDVVRPAFAAAGVAFTQWPEVDGVRVTVITRLAHDGEWISGAVSAKASGDGPQQIGSAITYLRRYAAMAAAGIAPDDDDGNEASAPAKPARQKRPDPAPTNNAAHHPSWDADRAAFCSALNAEGVRYEDLAAWRESRGLPRPSVVDNEERKKLFSAAVKAGSKGRTVFDDWLAERKAIAGEGT